jgi:diguanylate cyclase (GGDEF)-like protein/PAS domain S-box-containing protein
MPLPPGRGRAMPIHRYMKLQYSKPVRQHGPALAVLLLCCLFTIVAFLSEQRHFQERVALHTSADAGQFQRTLQQGVDSYLDLNRDLAAYFTASAQPRAKSFETYMRTADVLRQNPGLSYIGYIHRIGRADQASFEQSARLDDPELALHTAGADPVYAYPYLYVYPRDARSRQGKGLDGSVVPQRWAAMQQARDSGQTTATAKHAYSIGATAVPVILVFTPVYDPALPDATVAQRRIALRGFVFSVYQIEQMIERVMGSGFDALFDLEIYDGAIRAENILYDGDKRPHVLMKDANLSVARTAKVALAGREWQLFFRPKQAYLDRYHSWHDLAILAIGFAVSAALPLLIWSWTNHMLARSRRQGEELRFDDVFGDHPSAVYSLDRKRRFVNANAQALKELKVAKADLIGKSVAQFIAPEKQALAKARFDATLRGNSASYDSAIIDADGVRIELSIIMIPMKTGSEVTSVLGIGRNITEQKLSEWKLQESRKMLQLVINNIPQRVFWKDTNFAYLGCNEALARDAGLAHPDEIVGRTDFELPWCASADSYRKDDIEILASGVAKINFEEPQQLDDGRASWLRTSKIPLTDMDGDTVALLCVYEDITERKQLENRLREMAHYDGLTGLANRAFFQHQLALAGSRSRREGSLLALMYFDIDHFKSINDSFGHDCGDALLKAFAQRVGAARREMDVFARLGGDEFALLLEDLPSAAAAETVAAKLVREMQTPFQLGDRSVTVSTSIGVAFFQQGMVPDDLIQRADQAMYQAKRNGRNRFQVDGGAGAGQG